MALETGTYIDDLVSSNPPQSDSLTQAAGHLRLIKATIQATFPNVAGAITATHTELQAAADAVAAAQYIPAGSILPFAGSSTPSGYLLCYGQAVSRTTYSGLFTAISTTYGSGDGSTTFNVPDLREMYILGKANMGGTDRALYTNAAISSTTVLGTTYTGIDSGAGYAEYGVGTISTSNLPSHTHSFSGSGTTGSGGSHSHTSGSLYAASHSHSISGSQSGGLTRNLSRTRNNTDAGTGATRVVDISWSDTTLSIANSGNLGIGGSTSTASSHTHSVSVSGTTGSTGSGSAFYPITMQPSIVLNYIIKT